MVLGTAARSPRRRMIEALFGSAVAVLIALCVALLLTSVLHVAANLLLFLPAVLFAALRYGFWASLWGALLSVLATSFALFEPLYSFAVEDPATVVALLVFVGVAAVASALASLIREQAHALERRNEYVQTMYEFSARLAAAARVEEIAQAWLHQVREMCGADAALFVARNGRLGALYESGEAPDAAIDSEVQRCFEAGYPLENGTSSSTELYLPLGGSERCLGVARVRTVGARGFSEEERRTLHTLTNHLTTTLQRLRLGEEMQEARTQAEVDRLRAALLTAVSHDLRTPLASILGNITSLRHFRELYDEATCNDMLASAEVATERLDRFVQNLLDMTRVDAGAVAPKLERVDLEDIVGSALRAAERLLARHWVRVDLPEDLSVVEADFVLLEHVLVNLLDNAAKYSREGSLIVIRALQNDASIFVQVEDEGQGIPEQALTRVFDRFFRVRGGSTEPSGTGLGLAICKSFAEVMGGRISAANREGTQGAVFTVELRRAAQLPSVV